MYTKGEGRRSTLLSGEWKVPAVHRCALYEQSADSSFSVFGRSFIKMLQTLTYSVKTERFVLISHYPLQNGSQNPPLLRLTCRSIGPSLLWFCSVQRYAIISESLSMYANFARQRDSFFTRLTNRRKCGFPEARIRPPQRCREIERTRRTLFFRD